MAYRPIIILHQITNLERWKLWANNYNEYHTNEE